MRNQPDKLSAFWKTLKRYVVDDIPSEVFDEDEGEAIPLPESSRDLTGFPFPATTGRQAMSLVNRLRITNVRATPKRADSFDYVFDDVADDYETEDLGNRVYFRDLTRQVDFVLVVDTRKRYHRFFSSYLKAVAKYGVQFEYGNGAAFSELLFVKFYCPSDTLLQYAKAFRVRLSCKSFFVPEGTQEPLKCLHTFLTKPNPNSYIFYRARTTLTLKRPQRITPTERVMIAYKILSNVRYNVDQKEYSLERLMYTGVVMTGYPCHPGPWEWSAEGPLSDRQLLTEYWGRPGAWYKYQPLNVVEKYFGGETALYFAFVGQYNRWLLVPSVVGVACTALSAAFHRSIHGTYIEQVCNPTLKAQICFPLYNYKTKFQQHDKHTDDFCTYAKFNHVVDSPFSLFFAVFMGLWAILFLEFWRRKLNSLFIRWNIREKKNTKGWRHEFEVRAWFRRVNNDHGIIEPYNPFWYSLIVYSCTFVLFVALIAIIIAIMMSTTVLRILYLEYSPRNDPTWVFAALSFATVVLIQIIGMCYHKMATCLTWIENHKTQARYDVSYICKRFVLAFVNNYTVVFYLAFIRSYMPTLPVDMSTVYTWKFRNNTYISIFFGDHCHPAGCMYPVFAQVCFIMVFKYLISSLIMFCLPHFRTYYQKAVQKRGHHIHDLEQCEQDFLLDDPNRYFLINEYVEMVIQYGFVVFFSAAFPLGPLCALCSNLMTVRVVGRKLVKTMRRPIPTRRVKTTVWYGMVQGMTFLGLVVNALVTTFTSDLIRQQTFKLNLTHPTYLEGQLSAYLVPGSAEGNSTECYFRGMRHPPGLEKPYQLRWDFWKTVLWQGAGFLVLEHLFLILFVHLEYAIPDLPKEMRLLTQQHRLNRRKQRMREAEENITVDKVPPLEFDELV